MDMSQTIAPKSDQINADDLIGGPRTITITKVSGNEGAPEQPVNVHFDGDDGKPFRPCKSMRRVMVAAWGADASTYIGRGLTLYRDPDVTFGGMKVGGIRISHMSHIDRALTMALTASKAKRKPYTVKPLEASNQTATVDAASLLARAREAAAGGKASLQALWKALSNTERQIVDGIMAELKATAIKADEPSDDSLFGDDKDASSAPDPSNGAPMDSEWDDGVSAFKDGTPYEKNPYPPGQQADSWAGGWKGSEQNSRGGE